MFSFTNDNVSIQNGGYTKRAYVTFLAGSGDYIKGVVGLAKGLRKAKSAYPLVVAALPDVPEEHREILRSQGCIVKEIEPIYPPENQIKFAMAYYVLNYSKLRIWNLEEYDKMMYLDADIQVFENIDHLFDMPDGYFYAVMDCFCEKTWSHSPQYSVGYCQQCPDKVTWPIEMGLPPSLYFNAGMFVFEPNRLTYESLLEILMITPPTSDGTRITQWGVPIFFPDTMGGAKTLILKILIKIHRKKMFFTRFFPKWGGRRPPLSLPSFFPASNTLRGARFSEHVFPKHIQTNTTCLQPSSGYVVEAP